MFDLNNLLSSQFGIADEAYESKMPFERTVGFIKYLAEETKNPLNESILIIELNEGVFIRVQSAAWYEELNKHASEKEFDIAVLGITKWTELTRKYRAPVRSFGDERLAVWKVGFSF